MRGGELRLALIDRGLERFLFDREDHLAFLNVVSVLEQAGTKESCHSRL